MVLEINQAMAASRILLAVGLIVSAWEQLYWRREFESDGYFSWDIVRLTHPMWTRGWAGWLSERVFSARGVMGILGAQCAGAVGLLLPLPSLAHGALLVGLGMILVAMAARMPFGRDGSDQMGLMVCVALGFAHVSKHETFQLVCAGFLVCQLALSYLVAGVAKCAGAEWRNGEGLHGVAKTVTYGHPAVARVLEGRPGLARAAAWNVIGAELLLPFFILFSSPYRELLAALGVGFHLATAVLMRLTTFFWMFVAVYPLAFPVSQVVRRWLGMLGL